MKLTVAGYFAVVVAVVSLSAPSRAQQMVSPDLLTCTSCHDETTLLVSKQAQFDYSLHGSGDAWVRGARDNCAGCHGSEAAKARIQQSLPPHHASVQGVLNVSPYTCRTCHEIHVTYTLDDFAVIGDGASVELEMTGTMFDGGDGNLCAQCHQLRNELPQATNGEVEVATTRFGPHHGIEAQMILGEGGLGITSRPDVHYRIVGDTCVDCHMGPLGERDPDDPLPAATRNHTFEAEEAYCQSCHEDIRDFDYKGVQAEIQALLDEVQPLLIARGIMDDREGRENRSIEGTYPEAIANAMWNYMVVLEDGSNGIHHPDWARELLEYARDVLTE